MQVLQHGPGDAHAVPCGRSAPHLVQNDEAAVCDVVQNVGCLQHLHHEGAAAPHQVVPRADTREDAVHQAKGRLLRRDPHPRLSHDGQQRRHAEPGGFARHVGPREDDDAGVFASQADIVGDESSVRQGRLQHWVAAPAYRELHGFVHPGARVIAFPRDRTAGRQAVQNAQQPPRHLKGRSLLNDTLDDILIEPGLDPRDLVLAARHLVLKLPELRRHIAFGVDQRLTAFKVIRHRRQPRLADLKIVAEGAVVPRPQPRGPAGRPFFFQIFGKPRLSLPGYVAPRGKLLVEVRPNDRPHAQRAGKVLLQGPVQIFPQGGQVREGGQQPGQGLREGQDRQAGQQAQGVAQGGQVPGASRPKGQPGQGTFHVPRAGKEVLKPGHIRRGLHEEPDRILSPRDGLHVHQGTQQPLPQRPSAHGRAAPVQTGEERGAGGRLRDELKVALGRGVEAHAALRLKRRDTQNVADSAELRR